MGGATGFRGMGNGHGNGNGHGHGHGHGDCRLTGRGETETGADPACSADPAERPYLPHERLEVYRVALELHAALSGLLPRKGMRELRDQLERASTSIVLNIAEGGGRTALADKRRFYEMAKGSASECAAILDVLRLRGSTQQGHHAAARDLAIRVVQMLTRLCSGPR